MKPRRLDRARVLELLAGDLSAEDRRYLEDELAAYDAQTAANPLTALFPHSPAQLEFLQARTRIIAAFAGNRFGKTTSMVVKALVQLLDDRDIPDHLKGYRMARSGPVYGRIVVPDLAATLLGVLLPAFRAWTPADALRGGSFDKAYDKVNRILHLANGSWVQFMTYEMDLDKFGGAPLHFIGYDEAPPEDIRTECLWRLADYGGFEMFALTPLMGIGWIYRKIYKQRERDDITVVRGSIHDNPTIDEQAKQAILSEFAEDDPERRAREWGEFSHFGGMVYADGFEKSLVDFQHDLRTVDTLKRWDVVVGMDPGLRNAAFVWVGFHDSQALVFDEVLLQDKTPGDYVQAIRAVNARWGVKNPLYVIDPSARNRSLTNAESVQGELIRLGLGSVPGQNDVEAGVQQIRRRLQHKMLHVARHCRGLRDEAEEYRVEQRLDGEFKPVKENDHRLDALRYACMARPWHPDVQERQRERLGYQHDYEGPYVPEEPTDSPPLGVMS